MPETFIGLPRRSADDLAGVRVAVLGAAEASPYKLGEASHSADSPTALRRASMRFAGSLMQHDFDLGAAFFIAKDDHRGLADCGDVKTSTYEPEANRAAITEGVARLLAAGVRPLVLGGDDSVPIPVLAAYEGQGPLTILHIDAHVDWADVIQGNPYGYGSPMRRAAEMPWVTGMVQVGIRGLGSGEGWQHDDARAWGSHLVTSYDLHAGGLAAVLALIPDGARVFVSLDCDGIDPAVLPAVNMPTPGGLTYEDMIGLLRGTAAKAEIVGTAILEYVPAHDDARQFSGQVAARIGAVAMALMAGFGRAA